MAALDETTRSDLLVASVTDPLLVFRDPSCLGDRDMLEDRCRAYLEALRWPDGVTCPRCDSHDTAPLRTRKKFHCRTCRYQFSVTAGTVFHNSHLPVWKWFLTISVMLGSESGLPSNQLVRLIGGSYKTAWFVQHRIRVAIEESVQGSFGIEESTWRAREAAAERLLEATEEVTRLFDRAIVGPYHQVGVRYVGAYLAESEWRSRCRRNPWAFRDTVVRLLECDPLAYTDLITKSVMPVRRRSNAARTTDGESGMAFEPSGLTTANIQDF